IRLGIDALQQVGVVRAPEGLQCGLRLDDLAAVDLVEVAVVAGVQRHAISATDMGEYCFCFMSSETRWPRSSCLRVDSSRSEANCEKAASSRNCASARRTLPPSFLMILVCAAPPTRDTEMPALMAGRMPALNRSVSRNIWPS